MAKRNRTNNIKCFCFVSINVLIQCKSFNAMSTVSITLCCRINIAFKFWCCMIVSFKVSYQCSIRCHDSSFGTISMLAFNVWCCFNDCLHSHASEMVGSQVWFLIIEMVAFILWFRFICTIDVFAFMVWFRIIQMIVFIAWFRIIGIIEMVFMMWSSTYGFWLPLWYLQTLRRLCLVVI